MDSSEIGRRAIAAIARAKHQRPETIRAETTFEELGIDSLDSIEVLFELEEEFDLEIPDDVAQGVDSVGEVIERLTGHLAAEDS